MKMKLFMAIAIFMLIGQGLIQAQKSKAGAVEQRVKDQSQTVRGSTGGELDSPENSLYGVRIMPTFKAELLPPDERTARIIKEIDQLLKLSPEQYETLYDIQLEQAMKMDEIRVLYVKEENYIKSYKSLLDKERDLKITRNLTMDQKARWQEYKNLNSYTFVSTSGRLEDEPELYKRWLLYQY